MKDNRPPNGISASELAEYLGVTKVAIEKTLQRAKNKMKREAERLNIKVEEII